MQIKPLAWDWSDSRGALEDVELSYTDIHTLPLSLSYLLTILTIATSTYLIYGL